MIKAYFSSDPNTSLLQVVDDFLLEAIDLSKNAEEVSLDIMLFSFTDEALSARLKEIIANYPKIQIRIIADWGNISNRDNRKLLDFAALQSDRFELKFKFDLPYLWDAGALKLRWNYHASLGLLHHKSVSLNLDGQPYSLLCGSLNWTRTGGENYENLLLIDKRTKAHAQILANMQAEFNALWQDQNLSKTYAQASIIKAKVSQWFSSHPTSGFEQMQKAILGINQQNFQKPDCESIKIGDNSIIAFSSNNPFGFNRQKGLALNNAFRKFEMNKPSGNSKWVPLDIQTIALDFIYGASTDDELCLSMYAFSPRVPEYTALLEVARKGVKVRCILDRKSNAGMIQKLREVAKGESLDIQVKSGTRRMHQKYMVNQNTHSLITGTANMSTDSFYRHFEHRMYIKKNKALSAAFQSDFERIWERLED